MIKYEMKLRWSAEDNSYIVIVPELPGCMADGHSPEEAIANAGVVIEEWLETARALGRPIPKPLVTEPLA